MSPPGGNVLVVEDDNSLRTAIERLLQTAGMTCRTYTSAEELLMDGTTDDAACVVCDLKLPAMSGLDLLATLRSRGAAIPLILITAHDSPALREQAVREGAQGYLAKPFRGTALLAAVASAISG